MSALKWTRGTKTATYNLGGGDRTVEQTTHTATLTGGVVVVATKVDDVYFMDVDGKRANGGWDFPTLRKIKDIAQAAEDKIAAKEGEA